LGAHVNQNPNRQSELVSDFTPNTYLYNKHIAIENIFYLTFFLDNKSYKKIKTKQCSCPLFQKLSNSNKELKKEKPFHNSFISFSFFSASVLVELLKSFEINPVPARCFVVHTHN